MGTYREYGYCNSNYCDNHICSWILETVGNMFVIIYWLQRKYKMTKDRLSWIIKNIDFDILTPWEEKFIENCEEYFKKHSDLSPKMEPILEEIHRKKAM